MTSSTLGELDEVVAGVAQAKPVRAVLSGETRMRVHGIRLADDHRDDAG